MHLSWALHHPQSAALSQSFWRVKLHAAAPPAANSIHEKFLKGGSPSRSSVAEYFVKFHGNIALPSYRGDAIAWNLSSWLASEY